MLKFIRLLLISCVVAVGFSGVANAQVSVSVGTGGTGIYVGPDYVAPAYVPAPVVVAPVPVRCIIIIIIIVCLLLRHRTTITTIIMVLITDRIMVMDLILDLILIVHTMVRIRTATIVKGTMKKTGSLNFRSSSLIVYIYSESRSGTHNEKNFHYINLRCFHL